MKIIVMTQDQSRVQTFTGSKTLFGLVFSAVAASFLVLGGLAVYGWKSLSQEDFFTREGLNNWQTTLSSQQKEIEDVRQQAQLQVNALMVRVSELQGRMSRIDAMGELLTSKVDIDDGEFDFTQSPAVGGPGDNIDFDKGTSPESLMTAIDQLSLLIDSREQQLDLLDQLITDRNHADEAFLAGLPIRKGWLSSRFGKRTDPFTGNPAWHNGLDFAGKRGSDVIAVAAGVVIWSGRRSGYGMLVEVNHGNGYITRYAHNESHVVNVGDIVTRGQTLAKMGSSGRSTGPHVHFEVLKNGQVQDPTLYIYRASK